MIRALAVLALGGCVSGAGILRKDEVTLPLLAGAVAADLVVSALVISRSDSMSTTGAIVSGAALTAIDVGIGCILGACTVLRP
jgi:uncharacterized protein YcfL